MINEQKGTFEAENLLEELGFDTLPIIPSEVIAAIDSDDFRAVMEYQSFESDGILGKAEGNSHGALIYINSNIADLGRSNFTAAHEIGHVCMHIMAEKKLSFQCGSKELSNPFDDPIEKEANGFASGLLIPKNLISGLTDGEINWRNIWMVSDKCKASLEATYRRMSSLDNTPTAFIIHKGGNFKRFVAADNFQFSIDRTPLSEGQKTNCVDAKDKGYPSKFDTVDAQEWVNPVYKDEVLSTIYSSSINLTNGFTYTLISYDDDCLACEDDGLSVDNLQF